MTGVGRVDGWRWAERGQLALASPRAPTVLVALLVGLAASEALWHAETSHDDPTGYAVLSTDRPIVVVVVVLLGVATTLPVGVFWTQPAAAAGVVSAASGLSIAAFQTFTVAGLIAQLVVLYRLGRGGRHALAVGLAAPFVVLALVATADGGSTAARAAGAADTDTDAGRTDADTDAGTARDGVAFLTVVLASLAPAAAWAGIAGRARSETQAHREARHTAAGSLVEYTVRGERARISRELHDVVAHHISMIAVEAETARLTVADMPVAGAQRLSSIGDTARAALTEMRRLLGVLREDVEPGTDADGSASTAARQPQPDLRQLNDLLDAAREASGSGTRLIVSGPLTVLDPGVELAAYRIVQEALTNARRHAPGAAVDVEMHYTHDALRLRVRDNGPGPAAAPRPTVAPRPTATQRPRAEQEPRPEAGLGLVGMRERAAAVGGGLRTGAAAGGGFLVEATLPAKTGAAA